ncbi:putative membrane protein YeiB [Conyzicola lurida]|uniref:Putative membrane protein YeiB n=1 Tax=Conyzicola lurida TaxID=1172621 RepID=A0A841AK92_9MICO|nr:DUF418 domain-containing protein [Conyzicola lurida]MBB5842372.1 putative membrane protein YeiB [Conyzicola lurida]
MSLSPTDAVNPVVARLRAYGRAPRIVGIDIARGLAVLGMYGAHVGLTEPFDFARPGTWLDVVNGRSSILFALLAGVSIAIISGGTRTLDGVELVQARVRIFTRAAIIFGLGGFLEFLGSGIAIILPTYAALFVLALPFLRWRSPRLFALAGTVALIAPFVQLIVASGGEGGGGAIMELLFTGHYPGVIWIAFVLAGVGIGRLDLAAIRVQLWMLAAGFVLAVVGYGGGVVAQAEVPAPAVSPPVGTVDFSVLATVEAHSGSQFEVVGSAGFAILVVALCLLAARVAKWPLFPVAAVGSMALSAYTVHVLIVAVIGRDAFAQPDNGLYLGFVVGALVACSIWAVAVGRGPLEQALTRASRWAADTADRR